MRMTMLSRSIVLALTCCAAWQARAADPQRIDVPAGDLISALEALTKQSGVELIYLTDQLKGLRTRGVSGTLSAQEAVTKLLEGTLLKVSTDANGAMFISIPRPSSNSTPQRASPEQNPVTPSAAQPQPQAERTPQEANSDPRYRTEALDEVEVVVRIPEILVVGKRSINADIERTEDDVQPYVVFGSEEIRNSAAVNIEDFLKNRLPMNTARGTNSQNAQSGSNQSSFDLRGLGTNQTLILVNGRRRAGVSSVTSNDDFGQPDINGIPLALVERIEVLPTTASGIYGGGATGGVINIVLKSDYRGIEVQAGYNNTFESDVAQRTIDLLGGMSLQGGKTNLQFSASFADQNVMTESERDFSVRGRRRLQNNYPAIFSAGGFSPPQGYTTNILNRAVDMNTFLPLDLVLKPEYGGGSLGSPITYIPVGYRGVAVDGAAPLLANAGTYNLDLSDDYNGASRSLLNNPTVRSFFLSVRREVGERVSLFVDASHESNEGHTDFAGISGSAAVSASAPNNPFTTDIVVAFPSPGLHFVSSTQSENSNVVAGAIVQLPLHWAVQFEYGWGLTRTKFEGGSPIRTNSFPLFPPPPTILGTNAAIASGALNVLQDVNLYPLDYSPYLQTYPNAVSGPSDTRMGNGTLRLSGPVFDLPAGPVTLAGFYQKRETTAEESISKRPFPAAESGTIDYFYPERSDKVDSYYLEAFIPIVSKVNARSFARALEFQVSTRRDEYTTRSSKTGGYVTPVTEPIEISTSTVAATGYTLGLRYSPLSDVVFRASYGYGFLPPSVAQIGSIVQGPNDFIFLSDPARGNEFVSSLNRYVTGGNPNLKPEDSDSWSAGLIFTPRILPALRLSVDYTKIDKTNEIAFINVLDFEDLYPERVIRAAPDPTDPISPTVGRLLEVDNSLINIDRSSVEAFDAQMNYTFDTQRFGSFDFYALFTWQTRFTRKLNAQASTDDYVGFSDGPLKRRGNLGASWKKGPWLLNWNMQYFDSYLVYPARANEARQAEEILYQGSTTIPDQMYHDIAVRYRFSNGPFALNSVLSDAELSVGIQNVFNTSPPILATESLGGYSTYGDPRLRRYSLSVISRF